MSHGIVTVRGRNTSVVGSINATSTKGAEWHGLDKPLSVALAEMEWTLEKVPVTYTRADGTIYTSSESFHLIRNDTDTPVGPPVGPDYTQVQNSDRLALAETVVSLLPGAKLTACGAVYGGEDCWFSVEIPQQFRPKGEESRAFAQIFGNNTGRRSEQFRVNETRAICDNTRRMALSEKGVREIRIRHFLSAPERVREAHALVTSIRFALDSARKEFDLLLSKKIDLKGGGLRTYYDKVLPYPVKPVPTGDTEADTRAESLHERRMKRTIDTRKCWLDTFEEEREALATDPNLWLAFNSVSKWAQHKLPLKFAGRPESDVRWHSNNFGSGLDLTETAFNSALELARLL